MPSTPDSPDNQSPARFLSRGEVRLTRLLPGPIERVWDYLTDPDKRARWFAGGITEQRAGGRIEFVMHHAKLAPGETPPDRYKEVQDPGVTFEGVVRRCEPPRLLVFTFGAEDSEVTFELTPQGNQVLLIVTHRSTGDDRPELPNYASGWHIHLSHLIALLENTPRPPFWSTHARLKPAYDTLYASLKDDPTT